MNQLESFFPTLNDKNTPAKDCSVVLLSKPADDFKSQNELYQQMKQTAEAEKLFRLSVFLTEREKLLFLAPAGPDENETEDDLLFCAKAGISVMEELRIEPKIGIISGGREGDFGRDPRVDKTLTDAKNLQKRLDLEVIASKNYTILIEEAVKEANFLIVPNSLSGELILKTVTGIGEGREIGNILLFKQKNSTDAADFKTIYIEQLTEKGNPKDAEILKKALCAKIKQGLR
ncbi:hypothetical protein [Methanolapillus millepedarum]|uniref:Uncharacterized protein n=1 Tax=Methanolapillus millepedarum TaxID=3028296 RepID=A0AA96ZV70_9EURY|nr:hypothetical protein MsAc7_06420 [Methanosarcinaceae archaeon Ac7]